MGNLRPTQLCFRSQMQKSRFLIAPSMVDANNPQHFFFIVCLRQTAFFQAYSKVEEKKNHPKNKTPSAVK